MSYAQHVSKKTTVQTEKAKDEQKQNNAGGFSFVLDKWAILDRFLILGAEGNTYYCSEKKQVKKNSKNIEACIKEDGIRAVNRITEISVAGRAPKNDPAIFALALAASSEDLDTRKAAFDALPKVCRIGTHLFQFIAELKELRGFSGKLIQRAISSWYMDKPIDSAAYQVVKYQQRDGWSHSDMLRIGHPKAKTEEQAVLFRYIATSKDGVTEARLVKGEKDSATKVDRMYPALPSKLPRIIEGFERAKGEKDNKVVAKLITEYGLTHEMIPTESKNSKEVWEALLDKMPMTAMIRNLAKMTSINLLAPLSEASKKVVSALSSKDALKKARVHPIAMLSALRVYSTGHGIKGSLTWTPVQTIVAALDTGFYLAFDAIEPTGKNLFLALDVSGSMGSGEIAGVPGLTPRDASAALAMVTMRTEQNWFVAGFTSGATGYGGKWGGNACGLTQLPINPKMDLNTVIKTISNIPFGGTDCALPMVYAEKNKMPVDGFHVYTDSETWAGTPHPFQALKSYRKSSGRNAKSIVVGMTATEFTIADPSDAGSLDVVGFDMAAPQLMADFVRDPRPSVPEERSE